MKTFTLIAPAFWAQYLINGEDTDLSGSDTAACDAWLTRQGLNPPVSCSEDMWFAYQHSAMNECKATSVCEYTFLVEDDYE